MDTVVLVEKHGKHIVRVRELHQAGSSCRTIALQMGLKKSTVHSITGQINQQK